MKSSLLLLGILTLSSYSFANTEFDESLENGNEVGNGGNVIRCEGGGGTSFELLDFYEGRRLWSMPVDLGDDSVSVQEKLDTLLQRLASVDPLRADRYRKETSSFDDNAVYVPDGVLTPIDDTAGLVLPAGCALYQIAIQREPQFPNERRFTINKDVWDALGNTDRAGLIMHEVIYHEALGLNQDTSRATRYFTAHLSSQVGAQTTPNQYKVLLKSLGFPASILMSGIPIDYASAEFLYGDRHGDLRVVYGKVAKGGFSDASIGNLSISAVENAIVKMSDFDRDVGTTGDVLAFELRWENVTVTRQDRRFRLSTRGGVVRFNLQTQNLESLDCYDHVSTTANIVFDTPIGQNNMNVQPFDCGVPLVFSSDNVPLRFSGSITATLPGRSIDLPGQLVNFDGPVELYPDGILKQGTLRATTVLKTTTGDSRTYNAHTVVQFAASGEAI